MRACTSNNVNATRATCTGAMRGRARVHAGLFTKVHYNTIHFETGRALTAAHVWLHRQRMSCVWHSVCSAEIVGCAVLCGITLSHAWCYGFVLSLHARLQWRMNWGTCVSYCCIVRAKQGMVLPGLRRAPLHCCSGGV